MFLVFVVLVLGTTVIPASFDSLGDLGNLLGAFSQLAEEFGEECSYKCPEGKVAVRRPKHVPSSNGCGSQGISLNTDNFPDMSKCCDSHDFCYDTCGTQRKQCDEELRNCLANYCQQHSSGRNSKWMEDCQGTSNLISSGASGFGCQTFLQSQAKACQCVGVKEETKEKTYPKPALEKTKRKSSSSSRREL